jgi:hypothetical protein
MYWGGKRGSICYCKGFYLEPKAMGPSEDINQGMVENIWNVNMLKLLGHQTQDLICARQAL